SASVAQVKFAINANYTSAKMLYLTDRGTSRLSDGGVSYDSTESGKLSYGLAIVQIDRHLEQPISGPWDWVTRFFKGDPTPPSADRLTNSPITDFRHFSSVLARNLRQTRQDQVLVYIHGYRTSFDQVVQDATILGY